ncbi:MAG: hypothetical protein HFJ17_01015, partial [Clostridia bacterium]|nr:hypothetical protein [Clostridia bacterium]
MNFITKRNLGMKLLIVIFLMIFLFNNIFVNYSYGVDIGGVLFKPLSGLIGILLTTANATLSIVLGGIDDVWNIIMDHTPGDPAAGKPGWTDLILSPEHIFAGDYPLLDANIFNKNTASTSVGALSLDAYYGAGASLSGAIKTGVSGVYYILRNTCIVALLSVLIYTGIRIILSSNSPEKQGHWKMFLIDWMKAMALVIFIHVLMIAIFYVTDLIKEAFAQTLSGETIAAQCAKNLLWDSWDFTTQIISLVLFGYVTYLNIVFIIAYFKRLAWTVMLIVIAPVVAVMYPFRGVIDGKRAFDGWLKEFVMNAILPVYHIIIYYTLAMIPLNIAKSAPGGLTGIGGTFEILYSLFSITMIRPAEKFFRGLLGVSGKVANKGSFESGKKTLDAIGDAIKKVVEIAVVAAAGVATGGAS